jgi:hypothetical protein
MIRLETATPADLRPIANAKNGKGEGGLFFDDCDRVMVLGPSRAEC